MAWCLVYPAAIGILLLWIVRRRNAADVIKGLALLAVSAVAFVTPGRVALEPGIRALCADKEVGAAVSPDQREEVAIRYFHCGFKRGFVDVYLTPRGVWGRMTSQIVATIQGSYLANDATWIDDRHVRVTLAEGATVTGRTAWDRVTIEYRGTDGQAVVPDPGAREPDYSWIVPPLLLDPLAWFAFVILGWIGVGLWNRFAPIPFVRRSARWAAGAFACMPGSLGAGAPILKVLGVEPWSWLRGLWGAVGLLCIALAIRDFRRQPFHPQ